MIYRKGPGPHFGAQRNPLLRCHYIPRHYRAAVGGSNAVSIDFMGNAYRPKEVLHSDNSRLQAMDFQRRRGRGHLGAAALNMRQAGHVVAVTVGQQHIGKILGVETQRRPLPQHRIAGGGVQQQAGTVGTIQYDGGVGAVDAVARAGAEKGYLNRGHG